MINYDYCRQLVEEMLVLVKKRKKTWDAWIIVYDRHNLDQDESLFLYGEYEESMERARQATASVR